MKSWVELVFIITPIAEHIFLNAIMGCFVHFSFIGLLREEIIPS